jgi:cytochrome c-type biogenesis protein CcmF
MNDIQYLNEHLLPGMAGNFFVALSFASAFFAAAAYYFSAKNPDYGQQWKRFGRIGFYIHSGAVIGTVATLFYILFNHLYEYKYAFDHLNNSMPMKYVFSCMWEGQEGSFLLWTFWHVVLGIFLIRWAREWEPWVMTVVALVQTFLASMLLGCFFGEFQFGSNPFLLLREVGSNVGLPWTMNPDYLSLPTFQDGKGLNPLLQNYWMTIHPPTLFLGFASTMIPFAFAIAGLWKGDLKGWMKPAIPWAFFGVMILGTGILMGGAWAYEALGFGGFWAWDPVENASLVPWLTMVGSAHLLVINQRKSTSLFTALLLTISTFILILYSTFLTRSGVLGDSSVHSFVDSGILAQLLVYLLFFTAMGSYLMVRNTRWRQGYFVLTSLLFVVSIVHLMTVETPVPVEGETLLPGEGTWVPVLTMVFIVASLVMLVKSYKQLSNPNGDAEEALWSREFWMFIGSLVLTLAAVHITVVTSVNVGNIFLAPFESFFASIHEKTQWNWAKRMAEHSFSAPGDKERFDVYHRIQVPLAFVLFLIIAIGQYLRYKNTPFTDFLRKLAPSLIVSVLITIAALLFTGFGNEQFPLKVLLFATIFALVSNTDYAIRILKGKLDHIGASVAHMGFAMLIIGAIVSTSQSFFISQNKIGNVADLDESFSNNEDMMILKGDTLAMGPYFVHYRDKYKSGDRLFVTMDYLKMEPIVYQEGEQVNMQGMLFRSMKTHQASENFLDDWGRDSLWSMVPMASEEEIEEAKAWQPGKAGEKLFTLEPTILMSPKGNSREPSIHHSIGQDLYTFIKYTDMEEKKEGEGGYLDAKSGFISVGQNVRLSEIVNFKLDSLVNVDSIPENLPEGVIAKRGYVTLTDGHDTEKLILASVMMKDSVALPFPIESKNFKMLLSISEKKEGIELTVQEHSSTQKDMLIMTAQIFPQINILWLGCIVMVIGTTMAIRHRIKLWKKSGTANHEGV